MLLVLDIGNTNTVIGIYDRDQLVANWRLSTHHARTSDEWGVEVSSLLALEGLGREAVSAAIISSVVPPLTGALAEMIEALFRTEPLQVGPGVKTGVKILCENPLEVGADRIVNSVAALALVPGPAIVVDFGTATTFDALSSRGEYLGGAIVPGLQIAAESLFSRTAKLPRVEVRKPPRLIGRNTIHCIQSGLYYGYAAMVNGLIRRMRTELEGEAKVIVTGGLARLIAPELEGVDRHEPNLTLEGLRIIYQKNRPA